MKGDIYPINAHGVGGRAFNNTDLGQNLDAYSVEWTFDDGVKAYEVSAANTRQGYPAPFDQAIGEIKINLALGGRPGPLASGAVGSSGATFEMDYIRIIQL